MKKNIIKKFFSILIINFLIVSGFLFIFEFSFDNTKVEGIILTVNDDGGAMYTTIQEAIDNATNGDTISVWAGTYNENIIVNKSLTLIGYGKTNTTIVGGASDVTLRIESNFVNLTGFCLRQGMKSGKRGIAMNSYKNLTIENCKILGGDGYDSTGSSGGYGGAGVRINNGMNIAITNSTIRGGNGGNATPGDGGDGGSAIYIRNTNSIRIINNSVSGGQGGTGTSPKGINGHAVSLGSTSGLIESNNVSNSWAGITFVGLTSIIARNNTAYNNRFGVSFHDGSSPSIESNYFINNERGINAYNDGTGGTAMPTIINNTILNSTFYDIFLGGTHSRPILINTTFNKSNVYVELSFTIKYDSFFSL